MAVLRKASQLTAWCALQSSGSSSSIYCPVCGKNSAWKVTVDDIKKLIKVRRRLAAMLLHGGHARLQRGFRKRAGKSVVPAGPCRKSTVGKNERNLRRRSRRLLPSRKVIFVLCCHPFSRMYMAENRAAPKTQLTRPKKCTFGCCFLGARPVMSRENRRSSPAKVKAPRLRFRRSES